ncbi:hypothetical protein F5Y01DRAFT_28614 [Xylaria sp. FL0043]|nr:hypothetical protein F5Y01DRAFT_28614 [Xylaria sp. FL0043]
MSLLSPNYKPQEVTIDELVIASLAFGFTIGFGQLTTWTAAKQTWTAYKKQGSRVLKNIYIWMIWGEIAVCLGFAIICFLRIKGIIPPSFAFFFMILTLWALQVHFLLQIIINRCGIVNHNKEFTRRLKISVAVLITAINITVYTIWIPARLQISETYIHVNERWDRCEKVIYMLTDGFLNIYFIRVVQRELVQNGLTKYRGLVHFNMFIIGFSMSMDLLIITMMSLPNTFLYMQFHPLAYIVKLNIELSMADLIGRIAKSRDHNSFHDIDLNHNYSNKLTSQRSQATSYSGRLPARQQNIGTGNWDGRSASTSNDIACPDAVYTVNATANSRDNSIMESRLPTSRDIYTTREFRVDFEDNNNMASSSSHCSVGDSNPGGVSSGSEIDMSLLQSDQRDHAVTDDTSR